MVNSFVKQNKAGKKKAKKTSAEAHFLSFCTLWNVKCKHQLCLLADYFLEGRNSEAINLPPEYERRFWGKPGWKDVAGAVYCISHSWDSLCASEIFGLKLQTFTFATGLTKWLPSRLL